MRYNIKLKNGKRLKGWTTEATDVEKIIGGISPGGKITRMSIGAHHNGFEVYGTRDSPLSSSIFNSLFTTDNVAHGARFNFAFCNGDDCAGTVGKTLIRWIYQFGTLLELVLIFLVPLSMFLVSQLNGLALMKKEK